MGIYLPNMEMPTHCMDCPFMVSREGDDCILQSAEANANFENWEQMKAGCPLVPVPPHGRLIAESDAVETTWMILRGLGYLKEENPKLEQTVREVFATAPAIEVEEHG